MQPIGKRYIHSTLINRAGHGQNENAIIVKTHTYLEDGSIIPALDIIRNPKKTFYVTKPGLRDTYNEPKEFEDMENLDEYTVEDSDMGLALFKVFNGYFPRNRYVNIRDFHKSPYCFGLDISVESLINKSYTDKFNATDCKPINVTRGFFDIEADMETGDIIIASLSHENHVFTAMTESCFYHYTESDKREKGTLEELKEVVDLYIDPVKLFKDNKRILSLLKDRAFTFTFYIAKDSLDLLKWIFKNLHNNKTDFLGVWNLPYDIGNILKLCEKYDYPPAKLFNDPNLPEDLQSFRFYEDPGRPGDHFTRKWHWVYNAAHTKWYDAMCLYSILRIVDGFEANYTLDYILSKNKISDGKLDFKDEIPYSDQLSKADWHRLLQKRYIYEYIAYNIYDVLSLQVLEWLNNDVIGLHTLSKYSTLQNFNKQTRRSLDSMYFKCLEMGKVTACNHMADEDDALEKTGGAVLPLERTYETGLNALREAPSKETSISVFVNDIDLSALYPSSNIAANISRETKIMTLVNIENFKSNDIQHFCSELLSFKDSCVNIGKTYFNLPDYNEMEDLIKQKLK